MDAAPNWKGDALLAPPNKGLSSLPVAAGVVPKEKGAVGLALLALAVLPPRLNPVDWDSFLSFSFAGVVVAG